LCSGHNLGTAQLDAINEHPAVAESAIVGFPHDIKGNTLRLCDFKRNGKSETKKTCLKKLINIFLIT
jgi:acetyl-CoA synthetase